MKTFLIEAAKIVVAILFVLLMVVGMKTITKLVDARDACVASKQEAGMDYNKAMKECV